MANVQPNHYVMTGGGVKVTYVTSGNPNLPALTYEDGQRNLSFKSSEVRLATTEIGTLVTVTLQITVDVGSTSFSALIPLIELANNKSEVTFATAGIRTNHKTPLVQPPTGAREVYEICEMRGKASVREVPLGASSGGTA